MPKSKKEAILFSFLMSAIMIFLMAALNHAVRTGGLTAASWAHAVHAFIPGYLFGMLCDLLICTPFSRWITARTAGTDSRECIQVFIIRFSMVVTMTIFMTLFGVVAGGARGMEIATASLLFFPYNFTIALPVQMLAVAPFFRTSCAPSVPFSPGFHCRRSEYPVILRNFHCFSALSMLYFMCMACQNTSKRRKD